VSTDDVYPLLAELLKTTPSHTILNSYTTSPDKIQKTKINKDVPTHNTHITLVMKQFQKSKQL